ncbi:hypothetical protein [Bacteroides sp. 14(A)]|uniref:hypothetical protein n=1 Tax=Bacteroides sp. 14(A) TaxID=1163670 RepID=UPI00049421B3|nr:hypothetical protein [Bacteroides sp. 14(A)]
MRKTLSIGDKIISKRTGKILECYHVMPVFIGNVISSYEYSFFDQEKKLKTIKASILEQMLEKAWIKQ